VAIALLSVIAVIVVAYVLARAIAMNRHPQVVVADLVSSDSCPEFAEVPALSQVARRHVRRQIGDQRSQVARIVKSILLPAAKELEVRFGEAERMQNAASDSITAVLSALRSVVPGPADSFISLFALVLPPPRGISVSMTAIRRGETAQRLGISAEVSMLDGTLNSSVVFWESLAPDTRPPADQAGTAERVLALLEPVSRWIAVHLVLTLMVSPRRRVSAQTRNGLRRLLAGGLFLQAMRDFPDHAPAFGEEALTELEQARQLLPQIALPVTTLAGVHERIGWARQQAGEPAKAQAAFRAAVRCWRDAETIVGKAAAKAASRAPGDDARRAVLLERRMKAQLACADPPLREAALAELKSVALHSVQPADRIWRYNRACLYAQAYSADPQAEYLELSLSWLGLALIYEPDSSMWDYARQFDPELAPIRETLTVFLANLRNLIPVEPSQISETAAAEFIAQALGPHKGSG
jgi:hypothetical protein